MQPLPKPQADMEMQDNGSNLSMTDATLCSIARCILSSVDLLLISNLLDALSEPCAQKVMSVMKRMVKDRKSRFLKSENAKLGGFHKPKTVIVVEAHAKNHITLEWPP